MECCICYDCIDNKEFISLDCSHTFHIKCLHTWFMTIKINLLCPLCRTEVHNYNDKVFRSFMFSKLSNEEKRNFEYIESVIKLNNNEHIKNKNIKICEIIIGSEKLINILNEFKEYIK